jgi:hypothetical protein
MINATLMANKVINVGADSVNMPPLFGKPTLNRGVVLADNLVKVVEGRDNFLV